MQLAAIHRYPVKSLGGEALERATITAQGVAGDRRWMVVNPQGRFLTRRELPAMALLRAVPHADGGVTLHHAAAPSVKVAVPTTAERRAVKVWGDSLAATPAGAEADAWLSARLGQPVHLVHMGDDVIRPVDPRYGQPGDAVGFADGFPLLVTTQESLDALNAQLPAPITMARFRPNLVITGAPAAFAEEGWNSLRIGALTLRLVKPCTRCVITTQDPETGESHDREPLATLRRMGRLWQRQPVFGMNAIPDGAADLAVGDGVELG
ncbi:MOSC domain-containing protein [Novosphingobium capsulatum]|uniref:MOSC domain-containing protein n=1 Tax=Novosphingobium capsulatum TaxID=13688 RepID=UPI000788AA55|nr:MOSC N-terminal beta barrel domain-containing protein [Novosphingobium capsulatum]WQD94358.1 MOSC domain-containing protein [Novosphingobium capsulatum]